MKNRFFRKTWNGELIMCNVKAVVWIEGIRVISSLPFLQKALKRKNSLTSKKKLIKRKQGNKIPKAAFFCALKNFWRAESRLFATFVFLGVWKCVLCFFVRVKVFELEITLIPSIYTTTWKANYNVLISFQEKLLKCFLLLLQ